MPSVLDGLIKEADLKPDVQLQPHQKRVLKRLQNHPGNLLLMHALGSGKSLTGIASAEQTGLPYTAVVPASLRTNMRKELDKFVDPAGQAKADVMSYTGLAQGKPVKNDNVLFFDEAHRLRNPGSLQTQRAMDLAAHAKQVELLTGTPIVNDPSDLAVPMSILTKKQITPKDFTERYVGKQKVSPGFWGWLRGVPSANEPVLKHPDELKALLSGHVDYYAPEQAAVPTTREDVPVEMSTDQARLYRAMWGQLPWLLRWKLQHDYPLSNDDLRRATSFLVGPRQVGLSTYTFQGEHRDALKAFQTSTKLQEAYKRLTGKLKDPRTKALVFSNFIDAGLTPYAAGLAANNIPHAMFHGGLSDLERKKLVDDFNTGRIRVALLGPSGSEGLSFKGTQLVQLLDPYWNSVRGRQSEGRALRYDSHWDLPEELKNVTVQRYISKLPLGLMARAKERFGFDQEANRRAADDYLENMAARKDKLNKQFIDVLKEVGSKKAAQSWLPEGYELQMAKDGPHHNFTLFHKNKAVGGLRAIPGKDMHAIEEAYLDPEHRTPELGAALTKHIHADHKGENIMLPDGSVIPVAVLMDAYRRGGFEALPPIPEKRAGTPRYVYHAAPRVVLDSVLNKGLLGNAALLKDQEAIEQLAKARGRTREEFTEALNETNNDPVKSNWYKGPNVFFHLPPASASAKFVPNHPTKKHDLVNLRIDLDTLRREMPGTQFYGMELEPFDDEAWKKDPKGYEAKSIGTRERFLDPSEVDKFLAQKPDENWAGYNDPEGLGLYAPDVPHASIHTPSGTIPSKYISVVEPSFDKKAADEMEQHARNWVKHVMQTSFATYPPPGVFTRSPAEIADAGDQPGVAPKGLTSWQRMVLFHRNRGGRGLADERRQALQEAIQLLSQRRVERQQKPELFDQETLLPIKQGAERSYRDRAEMFALKDNKVLGGIYDNDRTFGVFGGGIEPGELPEEAAAREFTEESGYKVLNPREVPVPSLTVDWNPPYTTPEQAGRAKQFRGSRTRFFTGQLSDEPKAVPADPSGLQHIGLRRLSTALRKLQARPDMDEVARQRTAARAAVISHLLSTIEKQGTVDDVLYHGSPKGRIRKLKPFPHKAIEGEKAVFSTPDKLLALAMSVPEATGDRIAVGYHGGKFYADELEPKAFDLYRRPSYLYRVNPEGFTADARLMPEERLSRKPVPVLKRERIPDVFAALHGAGIDLVPYEQVPAAMKARGMDTEEPPLYTNLSLLDQAAKEVPVHKLRRGDAEKATVTKEGTAHESLGSPGTRTTADCNSVLPLSPGNDRDHEDDWPTEQRGTGALPLAPCADPLEKVALTAKGIPDRSSYGDPQKELTPGDLVDYIVQRHEARRAGEHYDIRLGTPETGLFSWASRKGVPEPGQKRLAIQQPLHSHSYGKFEGTIRKGYGAGKVYKHDVGQALVTKVGPDGSIHFTLAHTRFPERFMLLPPKVSGQKNWLMLNTTKTQPIPYQKVRYATVPPEKAEEVLGKLSPGSSVQQKIDGAANLVQLFRDHAEVLSYRQAKGCFAAGTLILLADGTSRPIEQILVGQLVATPTGPKRVLRCWRNGSSKDWLEISFNGHPTLVTTNHLFYTVAMGWCPIETVLEQGATDAYQIVRADERGCQLPAASRPRILAGSQPRTSDDTCRNSQGSRLLLRNSASGYEAPRHQSSTIQSGSTERALARGHEIPQERSFTKYLLVHTGEETSHIRQNGQYWWEMRMVLCEQGVVSTPYCPTGVLEGPFSQQSPAALSKLPYQGRCPIHAVSQGALCFRRLSRTTRKCYDLKVEGAGCYFADGFLVHNSGYPIVHTERTFANTGQPRPEIQSPRNLVGTVLRGELYGVNRQSGKAIDPQELGGLLNSSIARSMKTQAERGIDMRNLLFDIDRLGSGRRATAVRDLPYEQRMAKVKEIMGLLPRQDVFHTPEEAKTPEDAIKMWRRIALGQDPITEEGIVIHPPTGKPAKVKLRGEHDVYVREFFPGMGKYKDNAIGGFRYSHEPEGPIVGEVGTGLSDVLRRDMFQNPDLYKGRIARVLSPRKLPSGALFAPALLALHEDYPTATQPLPPPAPKLGGL